MGFTWCHSTSTGSASFLSHTQTARMKTFMSSSPPQSNDAATIDDDDAEGGFAAASCELAWSESVSARDAVSEVPTLNGLDGGGALHDDDMSAMMTVCYLLGTGLRTVRCLMLRPRVLGASRCGSAEHSLLRKLYM